MDEAEAQPAEGPPGATPALPPQRLDDSALPAAEDSNSSSGGGAAAEVAEAVEPNAEADVIQQHPAIVVPTSTPEAVEAAEVATGTHNDDNSGNSGELHGPAASISSYASSSSLYAGSASLVGMGGIVASLAGVSGNASIAGGLAPTVVGGGGGTLSPPHTLVNSDGASMRVHTGSIRERNFNRRISAIHEDDSDVYSESRRSDSLIFSHYHTQQQQQPPQQQQTLQQSRPSGSLHRQGSYHTAYHCARRRRCRRRLSDDDANVMSRVLSESDCFSVVSGISEGGASTTRVRLATDRAYDALRAGASASAAANAVAAAASLGLGYHFNFSGGGSSGQYHYRATSFATSSDPGLPNTGSFYDYYLDPNDYAPNSGSARDDEDGNMDSDVVSECSHTHHRCYRQDEDIVSLIRSDIAVYGSAADDIKFPFLPDNFSEFSGSVVYSPSGAFATSADYADHRCVSRDNSETYYHVPSHHHHHHHYQDQPPPPQLSQPLPQLPSSDNSRKDKKSRRGKDRLITRNNGKARDSLPSSATAAAANGTASSQIRNGTPARAVRPAAGPSGPSGPVSRSSRHYRRQSASEAYPTSATAVTVVAVTNASPAASSAIRQSNRTAANSPAIRPNALMRFFKRITPKT